MTVKLFHKLYKNDNSDQYLFILHGLFGMLDNWHNMARMLSEFVNVVAVDQRNHGQSPHTSEMSFELMADDLNALMDHLDVDTAIILGHSMGGKTAMVFADRYPDRVDKLIVADIAPKAYKPGHSTYFRAFKEIDFSSFARRAEADDAFAKIESDIGVRQFLLKNLERADKGFRLKFNISPIEHFYPKMIDKLHFQWLISQPSLFIYGGASRYVLEEDIQEISESFPQAEFVEIPGAGHWLHAEKPQEFFEAVRDFIS